MEVESMSKERDDALVSTVPASGELLGIPIQSSSLDVYSGVARAAGKIWAARHRSTTGSADTAAIFVHPTSNFLGHYMLGSLASNGVDAVGLSTRYVGNDSM